MSSLIRHDDNGNPLFEIGYTGISGYIKDGNMASPLMLSEAGEEGLTGLPGSNSLIGTINQLIVNSNAVSTYTNSTPMPESIGGYEAGTTFSDTSVDDMFNGLLYPYQEPAFSSFSFSGWSTTLEVGDSTPVNPTATWATTNSSNVASNSIDIDDITGANNLITGTANDGTQALTQSAVTKTSPGSNVWRVTGTNTDSPASDFTRDLTVNWYWKVYYGESANTSLSEAQIEALRVGTLKSGFAGSYAFQANNYKYICYPTSMGAASSFIDAGTGFPVAMESPVTVSVTNAYGQTTNYYVYRSTNPLVSSVTITVS